MLGRDTSRKCFGIGGTGGKIWAWRSEVEREMATVRLCWYEAGLAACVHC